MKEVLTCVPEELGTSERMVLMVIAENARDATRESWALTRDDLCRRSGLKPDALRKAFQRLAAAGLEVRVPLKFGKQGQPVYAHEGRQSTYRVPHFKRREQIPTTEAGTDSHHSGEAGTDSHYSGADPHPPSSEAESASREAGTQSHLWNQEVGTDSQEVGTRSRPTPHNPSSSSPTEKNSKGGAGGKRRTANDDEHPSFDAWYTAYPVHKARGAAAKAYSKALEKTDEATLFAAAKRYRDDPQVRRGYGKHPATWLNQHCWLDEPTPADATPPESAERNGRRFGPRDDVNAEDWSQRFKIGGRRR